jgi:hypothetical protein
MNRSIAARHPQSTAYGTPINPSPNQMTSPKTRVDQREHREVAADPLADLLHRPGRQANLAVAEEPDNPVAKLLAAHEHELHQDEHEAADPQEFQVGPMDERSRSWNCGCVTTCTFWIGASSLDSSGRGFSILAVTRSALSFSRSVVDCCPGLKRPLSLVSMFS